jgi:hypothetical protein
VLVGSSLPPWLPGPQGSKVSMLAALGAAALAVLLAASLVAKRFEHKRCGAVAVSHDAFVLKVEPTGIVTKHEQC